MAMMPPPAPPPRSRSRPSSTAYLLFFVVVAASSPVLSTSRVAVTALAPPSLAGVAHGPKHGIGPSSFPASFAAEASRARRTTSTAPYLPSHPPATSRILRTRSTSLLSHGGGGDGDGPRWDRALSAVVTSPVRSVSFSVVMATCGALLGPFLDSYHSAFGVLKYDDPIYLTLWGTESNPALITSWWVPPLFGLAGFIIGWLYIVLDEALGTESERRTPSPPSILKGISLFTFQYYLSGVLYAMGVDRTVIFGVMSAACALGYSVFDGTAVGFWTSLATAVGGPLIEVGLISTLTSGHGGYHYTDPGETGFFPLWIVPVYFLGGPAVGNLARGFWTALSPSALKEKTQPPGCEVCGDTRAVPCPNCDGQGYYTTYGRTVKCNACKGRGLVICRACFNEYGDDPANIERVREIMSKMPD